MGLLTESSWGGELRLLSSVAVDAVGTSRGVVAPARVGRYELLLDQLGMEDQLGDMDLKVAGRLWNSMAGRCLRAIRAARPLPFESCPGTQ